MISGLSLDWTKKRYLAQYVPAKTGKYPSAPKNASCQKYMKDDTHNRAYFWRENMLGYFSLDIILPQKLKVFLELRFWKSVGFSEQVLPADKYPRICFTANGGYFLLYIVVEFRGSKRFALESG